MTITKEQLSEDYRYFYKQVTLDKTDNDLVTDSITGLQYCKTASEDVREAKKQRAVMSLIDKYRDDFSSNWKHYLHIHFREKAKTKARILFRKEKLIGLDLLIKAYWGRTVHLDKWQNVMSIISYKEYASHFCSAILLEKEKTKSLAESFSCYGLSGSNEFLNQAINYMCEKFNPIPFEQLKIFPGQTHLKEKELINLNHSELDKGYEKTESQYISLIKSVKTKAKHKI